jgi:hypothetical protein
VAANPCAFGTNTNQMLLCQPAAPSICPGPQFCHVGDSPITTVCCNKPGKKIFQIFSNYFSSFEASVDVCHQPLNPGIGKSTLQRWYFYSPAGQCQTFTYRGLQGNENNFLSRVDCEQICPGNLQFLLFPNYLYFSLQQIPVPLALLCAIFEANLVIVLPPNNQFALRAFIAILAGMRGQVYAAQLWVNIFNN